MPKLWASRPTASHANRAWAQRTRRDLVSRCSAISIPHGAVAEDTAFCVREGMPERAVFVVDKSGIVRYIDVHTIGEQPDEEQIFGELQKLG